MIYITLQGYAISLTAVSWVITCGGNYTWGPLTDRCLGRNMFRCDVPPVVANAYRDLPAAYTDDEVVVYTCNPGNCAEQDRL